MVRVFGWFFLASLAGWLGYCATHIPAGPDVDVANAIGKHIASGYGKFDARQEVEKTGKGKIYYVSPGAGRTPTVIIYEVTSPEDVQAIETLAAQALVAVPEAKGVKLEFHERQNLSIAPSGAKSRGWEWPFKKVAVSRAKHRGA